MSSVALRQGLSVDSVIDGSAVDQWSKRQNVQPFILKRTDSAQSWRGVEQARLVIASLSFFQSKCYSTFLYPRTFLAPSLFCHACQISRSAILVPSSSRVS
jgi:hypothetical protein